ncbi:hypothetical protein LCGC14_2972370 [marine sediment metagenome]|uniref:Uncharacterized protein n=1 Tax=marine sediment metagenome TaxID=412755 RepID=A0A0F9A0A7_9ZZZZ
MTTIEDAAVASIRESTDTKCDCGEVRHHPGANYYVTVIDGPRWRCLAGPFTNHADALRMVKSTRDKAQELDLKAAFYVFGTTAMAQSYTKPGILNQYLGKVIP